MNRRNWYTCYYPALAAGGLRRGQNFGTSPIESTQMISSGEMPLESSQIRMLVVSLNARDEVLSAEYHKIRASQRTKILWLSSCPVRMLTR